MPSLKASCPACGAALNVPDQAMGKAGKCPSCGKVFPIPELSEDLPTAAPASEDDVLGWLDGDGQWQGEASSAAAASGPAVEAPQAGKAQPPVQAKATAPAGQPAPAPTRPGPTPAPTKAPATTAGHKRFEVRLGHVDEMGAFFLFYPYFLNDEDFRSAFPQRCVVCGKSQHLTVHLVIWSAKLPERGQLGTRMGFFRTVMELDKLGGREGRDLLAILGRIENLPEPYCLPFPYYVCRNCTPVGAVVPDVRPTPDGVGEICELGISSLALALDFVRNLCGEDCPAYQAVGQAIRQRSGDPWRKLPLAVRSRISQWYKPLEGERFVAYYPDGDFAKTEAGMAGVILTDRRLVYRKFAALIEVPLSEPMTIHPRAVGERMQLRIVGAAGKGAVLSADPASADDLRQQLRRRGAKARWVQ